MLIRTTQQIAGDASIENAVASVGHEVDEAVGHLRIEQDVDGRDKPGHDAVRLSVYPAFRYAHAGYANYRVDARSNAELREPGS